MASIGVLMLWLMAVSHDAQAATFQTVQGEAVIEAETYTRIDGSRGTDEHSRGWYVGTERRGYKGAGYLQSSTAGPSTLKFYEDTIRAEYEINFRETGTYYLHLRTWADDHTENGFFATLDGQHVIYGESPAYFIIVGKRSKWFWKTEGGGDEVKGPVVKVAVQQPGVKTLAIYRRDSGSRIDRIWLTKHQSNIQLALSLALPDPSGFIANGSTSRDGGVAQDSGAAYDSGLDAGQGDVANADGETVRDGAPTSDVTNAADVVQQDNGTVDQGVTEQGARVRFGGALEGGAGCAQAGGQRGAGSSCILCAALCMAFALRKRWHSNSHRRSGPATFHLFRRSSN